MPTTSTPPSILLVEDDPTSRAFFEAALKPLSVTIESADCVGTALTLAEDGRHALWLFDARLPDGTAAGLLARLRALGLTTPAIAHTASLSTSEQAQLLDAGFEQVLVKPLPPRQVQAVVQQLLRTHVQAAPVRVAEPGPGEAILPVWDDASADQALNGNHLHVVSLRRMFLGDLDRARASIIAGWKDNRTAAHAELHKLRASCGFVGAARLADAVEALQHMPDLPQSLERFDRAALQTLATRPDRTSQASDSV
ncbi:Hpt domain-containing response regulator [Marilutibacter alkalisoli]|nr:response regulator [Lysobacter alkalisoli]